MTMSALLLLSCLKGGARRTCSLGRETVMSPKGTPPNRSGRDAMEGRGNSLMLLYSELMQYQKVSHVPTENTTIRQPPVQTGVARHVEHAPACNANSLPLQKRLRKKTIWQSPVQTGAARHVEHAQACNENRFLAVAERAKAEENTAISRPNGNDRIEYRTSPTEQPPRTQSNLTL